MKEKYTIGREGTLKVAGQYNDVSREHAIIYIQDKLVIIEDKLPSNGVYVDGFRIQKKRIDTTSKLQLGRSFQFQLHDFFKIQAGKILAIRKGLNFKKEFDQLKLIYQQLTQREKNIERLLAIPRVGYLPIMMLGGLGGQSLPSSLATFGSVVFTLLPAVVLYFLIEPKVKNIARMRKRQLNQDFETQFCCPKCLMALDKHKTWMSWKQEGGHRCGAKWS